MLETLSRRPRRVLSASSIPASDGSGGDVRKDLCGSSESSTLYYGHQNHLHISPTKRSDTLSIMYFDLFVPFPLAETAENQNKGKGKGKGKAPPPPAVLPTSCWTGVEPEDKEAFAKRVGLAGHCEIAPPHSLQ